MKYIIILILFSNSLFAQMCNCKCDSLLRLNDAMFYQLTIIEIYGKPKDLNDEYYFRKSMLKRNEDLWKACIRNIKLKKA